MHRDIEKPSIGAVIIGRDEGERLRLCLESVRRDVSVIVYVDSGSKDQSVAIAQCFCAHVVELDDCVPFTAARARNAGFHRLVETVPHVEYVQFIDGDCRMLSTWWESAVAALQSDGRIAAVCGRLQEFNRNGTIYNRLIDIEWDTPVGQVKYCGGCAMYRVEVFNQAGGFNPSVIAGEEPELCVRLRSAGFTILRIDTQMAMHDANITRWTQWWLRNVRAGHAYAEGKAIHGQSSERHCVRQSRSIWLWGLWIPLLTVALFLPMQGWSVVLLIGYLALGVRIWRNIRQRGHSRFDSTIYSFFTVLGKWPQLYGQIQYWWRELRGKAHTIIEYKGR